MESAEPPFVESGEMGKGSFQVCIDPLVAGATQREAPIVCPLEIGPTMNNFGQVVENIESRLNRAVHVRFWGEAGVKFPRLTRLAECLGNRNIIKKENLYTIILN